MYRKNDGRRKLWAALLCVALVLVLCVAVTVVGLWVFNLYHGYVLDGGDTASSQSDTALHFTESDVRHTLFLAVDGGKATAAALVRFDPVAMRVSVVPVPVGTSLSYGMGFKRLDALYGDLGVRPVQDAVGAALGVAVRGTVVLTADGMSNWIERLGGGLPVTVDEYIEAGPLRLEAGYHTLTAAQVLQLLRAGNDSERFAWMVTAVGNRYLTADRKVMTDFDRLTAAWNTSSTVLRPNVIAYRTVLEALATANDGALCRAVALPGEWVGADDARRFELPDDITARLQEIF